MLTKFWKLGPLEFITVIRCTECKSKKKLCRNLKLVGTPLFGLGGYVSLNRVCLKGPES